MGMKGWVNGFSGSEAKILLHLLSQRDDIDVVEESIDMMDKELGDLCSTFNSLEEEERNQLILDGNALDYQLKVGYEQANGLFRLLNTILRSLRSRRRNVKVSENFEKKMRKQIAAILGIFASNRMSGQCRPPYNLELSLNFKNLSKNQRRKFGTTGISNGVVEDKIWKNIFVNQICEETISIVKEALKNGFTFAAFLDNYAVIKQRGMKTSGIVSKSVQTITMMGLLIKFPISPTRSISPRINFNNIRNILSNGTLTFNISHIPTDKSKILSRYDYFHFKSLPLSSGKYDDFITLNEIILEIVGDHNKPILMVQDSEFEAHHYRSKYDGKSIFNNNISCIASWHLMKQVIETFTYDYPDFMALIMAPIFSMVIKFKANKYKPFISNLYRDVEWKKVVGEMKLHVDIEMEEDEKFEEKYDEEEEEEKDNNIEFMTKNYDYNEEEEEDEEEKESKSDLRNGGRHNLRDRKRVKRKKDSDFIDDEEMNNSILFRDKPRKKDVENLSKPITYPKYKPPTMSYTVLQRVARALVRVWKKKKNEFLIFNPPHTPYAKYTISLLDLFVELVDPILQLYEGRDMRCLVESLPKYACFFAFMGKWKFLRYCICQMHTFNELITNDPQFLSVYLSNGLILSELNTEHENRCIANGRSQDHHWENAESMANDFLITAATKGERGDNYVPRMGREYEIGHHDR